MTNIETASEKETEKKAAEARGEASAYTTISALGATAWAAIEVLGWSGSGAVGEMLEAASNSKKTWHKVALVTGVAAIGAAVYAYVKHDQAKTLEAKHKNDWLTRIENERLKAKETASPSLTM